MRTNTLSSQSSFDDVAGTLMTSLIAFRLMYFNYYYLALIFIYYDILDSENHCCKAEDSYESCLNFLTESQFSEKEHELKQQMKQLKEEKSKLQKERETFAVAAVRLNKEVGQMIFLYSQFLLSPI